MNGATEIIVSGRAYKVEGTKVSYAQIVDIWNALHKEAGQHIIGTPGIAYTNAPKGDDQREDGTGILLPGRDLEVQDGTSFTVSPEHVS